MTYRSDYPKRKIGKNNPYWMCADCEVSDPEINGEIGNHRPECRWRKEQESHISTDELLDFINIFL